MSFDAAKLAYAYSFLRRKYLGPRLTSGPLESGKTYFIQRFQSGDNFASGAGADSNASGVLFVATATAPTWTHGSALREVKIAELRALADTTFSEATDTVTITSGSFEGGQGTGEITFEKVILGQAIEKLLTELDPDYDPPPARSSGFVMQFGGLVIGPVGPIRPIP